MKMQLSPVIILIFALSGGYLLGAIPFGLVLTRLAGLGDIRKIGSGNIGATNVLRTGNKMLALAVVLLDAGKGALAVFLASFFWGQLAGVAAGLGAVLGHLFPVWLGFKGGKGVATAFGTLLVLSWQVGVTVALIWLCMAFLFRTSSLAALIAAAAAPVTAFIFGGQWLALPVLIIAALIWLKHAANIRRLIKGTEPRISLSRKSPA
jgi:glycerol-3-phosphate acyltransferase PlsY